MTVPNPFIEVLVDARREGELSNSTLLARHSRENSGRGFKWHPITGHRDNGRINIQKDAKLKLRKQFKGNGTFRIVYGIVGKRFAWCRIVFNNENDNALFQLTYGTAQDYY